MGRRRRSLFAARMSPAGNGRFDDRCIFSAKKIVMIARRWHTSLILDRKTMELYDGHAHIYCKAACDNDSSNPLLAGPWSHGAII